MSCDFHAALTAFIHFRLNVDGIHNTPNQPLPAVDKIYFRFETAQKVNIQKKKETFVTRCKNETTLFPTFSAFVSAKEYKMKQNNFSLETNNGKLFK